MQLLLVARALALELGGCGKARPSRSAEAPGRIWRSFSFREPHETKCGRGWARALVVVPSFSHWHGVVRGDTRACSVAASENETPSPEPNEGSLQGVHRAEQKLRGHRCIPFCPKKGRGLVKVPKPRGWGVGGSRARSGDGASLALPALLSSNKPGPHFRQLTSPSTMSFHSATDVDPHSSTEQSHASTF